MSVACGVFKILCNKEGQPVDYVFVDVNTSFLELTGMSGKAVAGKKASELGFRWRGVDTDLLEAYAEAALRGKNREIRAFDPKGKHWLRVSIYSPAKEYFVTFINEISEEIQRYEVINSRLKNVNFGQKALKGHIIIDVTAGDKAEKELPLQRERLSFIVEGTKAGIWDWDLTTGEIYYDKQWKANLGYAEHEIKNSIEEWSKRRHPEDVVRVNQIMRCCLESKTETKYMNEYRLRHKNGEYRWILTTGKIMRNKKGIPLRWAGFMIDITDQKRVEELLFASKTRLVNFARAIPDTSFILDENGRYVEVFHDYDVWTDKSKAELHGRTVHEVLPRDSADRLLNQVRLTVKGGESQCIACESYRFGMKRFFEIHTAPMYYLAGGKKTVAVIINDITERRKSEDLLLLTYELSRRSDFFNDVISEKVILNENFVTSAKEMGIDVCAPVICCLLMCETSGKETPPYNNDTKMQKSHLIDCLKDEPDYVIWDCRDYIGILFQPGNQDVIGKLSGQELAYRLKEKIQAQFPQLSVLLGVSNIQQGLNSIQEAYKQAISALKTLQCQCINEYGVQCCYYGASGIFQLLTYYDETYATKFIEENIGGLIKYDKEKGADLLPTLEKILHSANLKQVAEKMFFHYKTVVLRKRRIEKILGISLDSFETRVALDAAIKLYKLQKTSGL